MEIQNSKDKDRRSTNANKAALNGSTALSSLAIKMRGNAAIRLSANLEINAEKKQPLMAPLAEKARLQAGYTLSKAAKLARLHPRRLREMELHGGATDATARRLCHFYHAGADVFHGLLFGPHYKINSYSGGVAALLPSTPEAAGLGAGVAALAPFKKVPPHQDLPSARSDDATFESVWPKEESHE